MRVAVVTQSRDRVGGIETYLHAVLPALAARHDVAFWSATDTISNRGAIVLPSGVPGERLAAAPDEAARQVRAWRPDVIFSHGLDQPSVEASVLAVAPSVHVQHTYHGTCISGTKTMSWPAVSPCERAFGPGCLAQYFPRRCGGSSPITMTSLYRTQASRLQTLRRVAAVMALSNHMAAELRRNGVPADRVHVVPPFVTLAHAGFRSPDSGFRSPESAFRSPHSGARIPHPAPRIPHPAPRIPHPAPRIPHPAPRIPHPASRTPHPAPTVRLLFLGRLEPLKGVRELLDALTPLADRLDRPVSLVVAGDGSERHALEIYASSCFAGDERIRVRFTGWQGEAARARLFADADALVVPSLLPEPFGLVGLEAAAAGLPAVAFAVGGIPEWLREGENGCLAPAAGARPGLLADAIARCVSSPAVLAALSDGARAAAAWWTIERHMTGLDEVLAAASKQVVVSRAS